MFIAPQTSDLEDLPISVQKISELLKSIGVHLDTPLAPAFILAACDTLMSIEVAAHLEPPFDMSQTFALLSTWSTPQPEPVRLVQQAVLHAAPFDTISTQARAYLLNQLGTLDTFESVGTD